VGRAARELGFGSVIKILLQFNEPFWRNRETEKRLKQRTRKLGFLFADTVIPTWWTQYPDSAPMLTGWLGGPATNEFKLAGEQLILQKAFDSLARIFREEPARIASRVTAWHITDWSKDIFSQGAYSFKTVDGEQYLEMLRQPVEGTIFFAGEALAQSAATGTVEAALESGINVAAKAVS
jgi:monoamine oxidase